MTLFGLTLSIAALRFGRQKAKKAHHYMERAVDYLKELIKAILGYMHWEDRNYDPPKINLAG